MTQAANLAALGSNVNSSGIAQAAGGGTAGTNGAIGFKNRIINGAMVIAQYGTSNTTATGYACIDRWAYLASQANKGTWNQNFNNATPPAGFTNYLGFQTGGTPVTLGATDYFQMSQNIEGYNIADLAWGTSSGKTVTLSFWVYATIAGNYSVALGNNGGGNWYPILYSIPTANTWTYVSVNIPAPPVGSTWLTNNGIGIQLRFSLGTGSTYTAASGVWNLSQSNATGSVSVVGTASAQWYVTGVQLEVGSAATNFDVRSIGTELALCQRYLPAWNYVGSGNQCVAIGFMQTTVNAVSVHTFPVATRTAPTGVTVIAGSGSFPTSFTYNGPGNNPTAAGFYYGSTTTASISWTLSSATQWQPTQIYCTASGSLIYFTGCEL
jgi:hypothetical protein